MSSVEYPLLLVLAIAVLAFSKIPEKNVKFKVFVVSLEIFFSVIDEEKSLVNFEKCKIKAIKIIS
jgi:hypothetical protein